MPTKPSIVVRTYKRSDTILQKTLDLLSKQTDIDLGKQLYLVVADQEEMYLYSKILKDFPVASYLISGLGGHKAIAKAVDYFPEGTPFVFMDDDLADLKIWKDIKDTKSRENVTNLGEYFSYIFDRMDESKCGSAFGVDFTPNLMFKQDKPFFEFKARKLGGAWWGGYNQKLFKTEMAHEDDNIRTARLLEQDGGVFALNWMTASTKIGLNAGGMQASGCRANTQEARLNATKENCYAALKTVPEVAKYYEAEPYFKDSMNFYTLKIKNIRELRNLIPNYTPVSWTQYMQAEPDKIEESQSLDSFF